MEGKAKAALTFALYQGGQLLRKETIAQDIVKVGKDPRSHLRVDDELASRMHAVIEVAGPNDITLIDLGNEPGTMVNGQRVNKCKIRPGDQVQIGSTTVVLESAAPADSMPAVAAAPAPSPSAPPPAVAPAMAAPEANPFAGAAAAAPNPFGGANPFAGAAAANPFAGANPFANAAPPMPTAAPMVDIDPNAPPGSYTYQMVKSGPDVNPDEVEVAHQQIIEVMVMWDTNVLHVQHLQGMKGFYVGEEEGTGKGGASCDYFVPSEVLGTTRAPVVTAAGALVILPRTTGWVDIPGQGKKSLQDLISANLARQSHELSGAYEFQIPPGGKARMELPTGIAFQVTVGNAGKSPPVGAFSSFEPGAFLYSGLSFLLHVGILASLAFFMPGMNGDDS